MMKDAASASIGNTPDTNPIVRHSSSTVFIGNLSFFCKENDIVTLFSSFGTVINVEVAKSPEGSNLLYGYIELDNVASAQQSAMELNGKLHQGRFLRVRMASDPPSATVDKKDLSVPTFTVHVRFVTHNPNLVVDEEFLHNLFIPFGEITDISIRRYYRQVRRQYGYAFVEYLVKDDATKAATQLEQFESGGVKIYSTISRRSAKSWGDNESETSQEKGQKNAAMVAVYPGMIAPTLGDNLTTMLPTQLHQLQPVTARQQHLNMASNLPEQTYYTNYISHSGAPSQMAVVYSSNYSLPVPPSPYFPVTSQVIPSQHPTTYHQASSSSSVQQPSSQLSHQLQQHPPTFTSPSHNQLDWSHTSVVPHSNTLPSVNNFSTAYLNSSFNSFPPQSNVQSNTHALPSNIYIHPHSQGLPSQQPPPPQQQQQQLSQLPPHHPPSMTYYTYTTQPGMVAMLSTPQTTFTNPPQQSNMLSPALPSPSSVSMNSAPMAPYFPHSSVSQSNIASSSDVIGMDNYMQGRRLHPPLQLSPQQQQQTQAHSTDKIFHQKHHHRSNDLR